MKNAPKLKKNKSPILHKHFLSLKMAKAIDQDMTWRYALNRKSVTPSHPLPFHVESLISPVSNVEPQLQRLKASSMSY